MGSDPSPATPTRPLPNRPMRPQSTFQKRPAFWKKKAVAEKRFATRVAQNSLFCFAKTGEQQNGWHFLFAEPASGSAWHQQNKNFLFEPAERGGVSCRLRAPSGPWQPAECPT